MVKNEKIVTPENISYWLTQQIDNSGIGYIKGYYAIKKMHFNPNFNQTQDQIRTMDIGFTIKGKSELYVYETKVIVTKYTDTKIESLFRDEDGKEFIIEMVCNTHIRTMKIGTIYIFVTSHQQKNEGHTLA